MARVWAIPVRVTGYLASLTATAGLAKMLYEVGAVFTGVAEVLDGVG